MHVAVFGAGYAGLTAVRELERSLPDTAELTLVNDEPYHLVQHELHRAIRRPTIEETIRVPLEDVLDHATFVEDRVEQIDREAGTASLSSGETLSYDYAAVCLGAETAFYDLPGVEEHAIPLKRLEHADRIRSRFHATEGGQFLVGGAGLSGIQVAGELAAVADEEEYDADIILVEMADSVAPGFDDGFQQAVREELDDRGIDVRTGAAVASANAGAVEFGSGERIEYDGFIWTGGIRGSDALAGERPDTRSTLRETNGTFLVGDAARVVDSEGTAVPASAQTALREARVAAANIAALVEHDLDGDGFEPSLDRYTFDSLGWVVTVGDGAVAQVGPSVLRGRAARAAKATVGAAHLSAVGAIEQASQLVREEL